jgi:hypothetical protein
MPTPEPTPGTEPEPTPEPSPDPTATPDPSGDTEPAPEPEPTPTVEPTPDPTDEPDDQETNPGPQPFTEILTGDVSIDATSGATGSYAVSGFSATFRFNDSRDEFYVAGGLIVDDQGQGYWYTQAVSLYSESQPYIDCLGGSRDIWGGKFTTGPGSGCISDAGAITPGETYEVKIIRSLYPNEPYSWNVVIVGLGQSDIGHDLGFDDELYPSPNHLSFSNVNIDTSHYLEKWLERGALRVSYGSSLLAISLALGSL